MKNKEGINPKSIKKYWKNYQPPDISKLKKEGKNFVDPTFPPNKNSLTSKKPNGEFVDKVRGPTQLQDLEDDLPCGADKIEWKRPSDISPKWSLFEGKIEFNDVQQGSLGDCYFLSSITALTEYPYILSEKFRTEKYNDTGYYEVIFFIDGEWQILFLDDYFPFDPTKNNFAFAKPNNNELWAMLLEKAWAKLNGGYSNIIGGIVSEPIAALTSFPTEYLPHKQKEEDEIYEKIENGDKEGSIMSSASKADANVEKRGLVKGHAYTLITAKKYKERNIYLIKLRNPWGEGEWTGKWSDNSSAWTDEYKKYFNYQKTTDDGIFWIDVNDYMSNFESTYICYILYGSFVKNFFFEYQSYFKKPVVFNMRIKERSKTSVGILFKSWRFNREVKDLTHPFSLIVCKYDKNRNIEKLWGNWGCKEDLNVIDVFEPGLYVIWLYLATKGENDPNFRYTVQVSSVKDFDIELLGLDSNYQLIQYLLLENYKKTGANNLSSSKDYFIGSDRDVSKIGLSNFLFYNKTGKEIEVKASEKAVSNVAILPPYEGMRNIQINIPPYESVAIIAVRLTNDGVNFSYGFQFKFKGEDKENDPNKWKQNNGEKYASFLKLNIVNSNPETMGLRHGEYKYVGIDLARTMPKFDASQFVGKAILEKAMKREEKVDKETLKEKFPEEMKLLLDKFEIKNKDDQKEKDNQNQNKNEAEKDKDKNKDKDNEKDKDKEKEKEKEKEGIDEKNKKWDYVTSNDGKYIGQIDATTGNLDGKGIFVWNNGMKYLGNWKDGNMNGEGAIYDKDNKVIFEGNYVNNKKYGHGIFNVKDKEYYDGDFFDDKMEGKGSYHYENGDTWEGDFKDNKKNGVGILTYNKGNDIVLYEFENDNYMGATELSPEEKKYVQNLQKEERQKLLDDNPIIAKRESEFIEERKRKNTILSGLNKYTQNLFLQKSMLGFGIKVTQMAKEFEETEEEKKHRLYLENIESFKKKEPFMMEKFLDLQPSAQEEEMHMVDQKNKKYLGGMEKKNNDLVMQGRGVLNDGKYYYVGNWNNNEPTGLFRRYTPDKKISFEGYFTKDFKIDPNRIGKVYFNNGEKYEGFFYKNQMHGFGTYYFPNGNSFTGTFNKGKLDGTGKYFYDNGLISEIITYKNNKVAEKFGKIREDYRDPTSTQFFKDMKAAHPGVIEHILEVPPMRDAACDLYWVKHKFCDGDIFIGQITKDDKFLGRCCVIYPNDNIRYFVGYISRNKEFFREGAYYDRNWKKIYEGNFEHNQRSGFGILLKDDGSTYAGEFLKHKPNGKGVIYYKNGSRIEGNFVNGYLNDKGYLINGDYYRKQEIVYSNGNIIEQGEIIDYSKAKYKKQFQEEFIEFEKKCKEYKYEKYMDFMMNIKATKDTYMLKKGIKQEVEGVYIGEMNSIGFKHGRGVLVNTYDKTFYVGYFLNNEKSGKGVNYNSDGKQQYIGEFKRNKPCGKGEFRYKNGEVLQGTFNSVGEGKGVYTFDDGAYWRGNFYAWTLNGNGTYYTKEGYIFGEKAFELNKPVEEQKAN